MKIYIAGKITGDPNYREKFLKAEKRLREKGHSVMNPAWLRCYPEFGYKAYMAITCVMQKRCKAVLFLPDWQESNGARQEFKRVVSFKQEVYFSIDDVPPKYPYIPKKRR